MPITSNSSAPYAPPKAVTDVVEFHRKRGLPSPITLDVITKVGVSESLAPRTLQAFRLLDLVDEDGNPTATFEGLRVAPESEYRDRFAEMIRAAYAEIFHYRDPATDDWVTIRDAFRSYTPFGMQERMVNLFFGLCVYTGIIDEIPKRSGANGDGQEPIARAKAPAKVKSRQRREPKLDPPAEPELKFTSTPSEAARNPFVIGLIGSLPSIGSTWPDAKREDWIKAALAVFNIIYERPDKDSQPALHLTPSGKEG